MLLPDHVVVIVVAVVIHSRVHTVTKLRLNHKNTSGAITLLPDDCCCWSGGDGASGGVRHLSQFRSRSPRTKTRSSHF
jgi:hypothetical protein